jgi:proline iminopeptidase
VADLDALRAALHLPHFALVGDSYGGFLAIAYTLAHPEHVAALILSDAPGPVLQKKLTLLPEVFPDVLDVSGSSSTNKQLTHQQLEELDIRQHLHMFFYSPQKAQSYLARSNQFGYLAAVDDAVSTAAEGVDFTQRLSEIEAPTLVLNGRFDMNVPPLTAWRMAHTIPHAQSRFFERSGHFPAYEEPRAYQNAVEEFLARLPSQ